MAGTRVISSPLPRLALRKSELADALGVSVDFVDEHVWPELRIVRRGRIALVDVREVERWLEENAAHVLDHRTQWAGAIRPSRREPHIALNDGHLHRQARPQ